MSGVVLNFLVCPNIPHLRCWLVSVGGQRRAGQ